MALVWRWRQPGSTGRFELVLANAQHIRNVPGRKTDVNDAMWIADLLAHGLDPKDARGRKHQACERALERHREERSCNARRDHRRRDRPRASRRIGGRDGAAQESELIESLRGRVSDHHRGMLKLHLALIGALEAALAEIDATAGKLLAPIQERAALLTTMSGVTVVSQAIVAEIGVDMSRFPAAGHLVSWAGLCPRNDESAGKRRSTRVRKTANWVKTTLVTAAWSASRKNDSYLRAQFLRIKCWRGAKKAILAVAASMLAASYYMLRRASSTRSRSHPLRPPRPDQDRAPSRHAATRPRLRVGSHPARARQRAGGRGHGTVFPWSPARHSMRTPTWLFTSL
jgi:transposase